MSKKEELQEVLRLHKMWLNDEEGGKRASLININTKSNFYSGFCFG